MTLELLFENSYDPSFDHYEEDFQDLASYTFSLLNVKDHYSLEVDFVRQDEIHEINKEYRGIDCPTDVISFAFLDKVDGEVTIQGDVMQMLGEIIIPLIKQRCKRNNMSILCTAKSVFYSFMVYYIY